MNEWKLCGDCEHFCPLWPSVTSGDCTWEGKLTEAENDTCEHFALLHDIDRLERIIREAGKVREYAEGLVASVDSEVDLVYYVPYACFVALAALTPEQRAVVARKVLEEAE